MKNIKTYISIISFIIVCSFLNAQYAPRLNFNAKFEPVVKVIHNSDTLQVNQYTESDSGHPFLIVNKDMYADMRAKATQSPWKEMKESARTMFAQPYDETLADGDDKAILLRDMISSGTLLWILEPDSQATYQTRIVETLYKFNDVLESRVKPDEWPGTVPVACAAFNAIIAMDVLYNDMDATERDSLERLYFSFLETQRSTAWKESYYASLGIYYLYKGDRENIDFYKQKYRKELEDHITGNGIFTGGTGYSTSRFIKDEREQKYMFMDVLEFTEEDNYYDDPLFQEFHEWLFGHNFNTYGSIYIFGDAKMGTSIRGRLEESAATWRVNRFSGIAAQNAAWQVQGKTPVGRLLNYLAVDSLIEPVRPNTSTIYPDGGAWFVHNPSNEEHLSGVLWNPKSYTSHSHKETNSLHLAAFGEDLVVNSGYSNWGNGALGFSWNYIHDQAKSSNTVLINNKNHNSKKGGGLSGGFIIDDKLAYASGEAGPALNNGTHTRTLHMLYPTPGTAGYWVLFDEVKAYNPAEDFQVLLHPRSYDVQEVESDKFFTWNVQRWNENGVDLSILLATPPTNVSLIDGVQADKSSSLLTKVLKSTYTTDQYGENHALTIVLPSDQNHPLPQTTHISDGSYHGVQISQADGIMDEVMESKADGLTPVTRGTFAGDYFFQRVKEDSVLFAFGRNIREFYSGEAGYTRGFSSSSAIDFYLDDKTGKIDNKYATIVFTYPGITGIKLNGEMMDYTEDGINTLQVTVPTGQHDIEIIATGIPEEDNSTGILSNKEHSRISVFPNPVTNSVTISGLPANSTISEIKMYDLSGRLCHNLSKNDMVQSHQSCYIRLGNLTDGVYFLNINYKIGQDTYNKQLKIIKNK